MDEIVKAAMKKWPNVPNAYGWLALDARGDWYLRDLEAQAAGPFAEVKGSLVEHAQLKAFIGRNYASDERGAWFFQNGPQRVFVELALAPWVLGVRPLDGGQGHVEVLTHTDVPVSNVRGCWLDEVGRLYLHTEHGLGVVRSMDMATAAEAVESGVWGELHESALPELMTRFGFVRQPQP